MNIENLKYPIGKFIAPEEYTLNILKGWIEEIESFPEKVVELTQTLTQAQLNWIYRPEGWSIKQVVHHCADSHMNSFIRFKLALTESTPTIRPYHEDKWAELSDSLVTDLTDSILLLKGLHAKWGFLLRQLTTSDLLLKYVHPEHGQTFTLQETIGSYAWHCQHHLAHIVVALDNEGKPFKL